MRAASSKLVLIVAGLACAVVPRIGSAQGDRADGPRDLITPYGEYVLIGGGVTDFTKDGVKDRFDAGGSWDARLGFGSRFYVGGEVAYVGSAQNGKDGGPDLMTNGAEGVLRLQYPWATGDWLVEPFAFGGLGYSRVSLRNAPAGLAKSDNVGVVPFGAGVTVGYKRVLLDARFTYRTTFNEDLALGVNESPANLERWGVGASIGYEF